MIDRSAMMVRACGASVLALTTYLLFRWARAEFRSADMTLAEAQRPFVVLVPFGLGSAATIAPAREGDMLLDPEYGTPINSVYAVAALTGLALHGGGGGADVQMERLERLNLLRPSLKVFRDKVRTPPRVRIVVAPIEPRTRGRR